VVPRDATMILLAFRHGLRAAEACDVRWKSHDTWAIEEWLVRSPGSSLERS
jgi:integrase